MADSAECWDVLCFVVFVKAMRELFFLPPQGWVFGVQCGWSGNEVPCHHPCDETRTYLTVASALIAQLATTLIPVPTPPLSIAVP